MEEFQVCVCVNSSRGNGGNVEGDLARKNQGLIDGLLRIFDHLITKFNTSLRKVLLDADRWCSPTHITN